MHFKKYFIGFSSLAIACAAACSSTDDDTVLDASLDQSVDQANDVVTKDSGKDAGSDAAVDASDASTLDASDASVDAPTETSLLDAPLDVILDVALDVPVSSDAGVCTTNATCNQGDFCDKSNGNCGGKGACMAKPQFCSNIFLPVCGCDKVTYSNACHANAAGVSIAYTGTCE